MINEATTELDPDVCGDERQRAGLRSTAIGAATGGRARVVELVGLPGAGKSTIIRELALALGGHESGDLLIIPRSTGSRTLGIERSRRTRTIRLLTDAAAVALRFPLVVSRLVGLSSRASDGRRAQIRRVLLLCQYLRHLDRYRRGLRPDGLRTVLFEEGLLQMLATISLPSTRNGSATFNGLPDLLMQGRIDGVVFVDCPPTVALERIQGRSSALSRFDRWPSDTVESNLEVMAQLVDDLFATCSRLGVPCAVIAATQDAGASAAQLLAALQRL